MHTDHPVHIDQRHGPRRAAGWRCVVKDISSGNLIRGRVENVSPHGLLIVVPDLIHEGSDIAGKVEVTHAGRRFEFSFQGKVVHNVFRTATCLVGVEITRIDKHQARFLDDYSHGMV